MSTTGNNIQTMEDPPRPQGASFDHAHGEGATRFAPSTTAGVVDHTQMTTGDEEGGTDDGPQEGYRQTGKRFQSRNRKRGWRGSNARDNRVVRAPDRARHHRRSFR